MPAKRQHTRTGHEEVISPAFSSSSCSISPLTLSFSFEMLKCLVHLQSVTQIHTFCATCIAEKEEFATNN